MKLTIIETIDNDGFFIGQLKEFPQVISEGKTKEELIVNMKDALKTYFDLMIDTIYFELR